MALAIYHCPEAAGFETRPASDFVNQRDTLILAIIEKPRNSPDKPPNDAQFKSMSPSEVSQSYDMIATRRADSGFDRQNGVAQHARALQFVSHRGKALDVGCGSSGRFIELLTGHGFDVEGLDISVEMIRLAHERHPDRFPSRRPH